MATTEPTQSRYVDPFAGYSSATINALTRIVSKGENCVLEHDSMDVSILTAGPPPANVEVRVSAGSCIKDDILIEIQQFDVDMTDADFYVTPSGGDELSEDGYYYIVLDYTYVKSRPAPIASIKIFKPSQRGSFSHDDYVFLKVVDATSSILIDVYDADDDVYSANKRQYPQVREATDSTVIDQTLDPKGGRVCLDSEGLKGYNTSRQKIFKLDESGDLQIGRSASNQLTYTASTDTLTFYGSFSAAPDSLSIAQTLAASAGRVCLDSEGIKAWDTAGTPNQTLAINESGGVTIGYSATQKLTLSGGALSLAGTLLSSAHSKRITESITPSGSEVYLDAGGFKAYNSSTQKIVDIDESANVTIGKTATQQILYNAAGDTLSFAGSVISALNSNVITGTASTASSVILDANGITGRNASSNTRFDVNNDGSWCLGNSSGNRVNHTSGDVLTIVGASLSSCSIPGSNINSGTVAAGYLPNLESLNGTIDIDGQTDLVATESEVNQLSGAGCVTADFTKLAAITSSAAELSVFNGAGLSATELGRYTTSDGVYITTSNTSHYAMNIVDTPATYSALYIQDSGGHGLYIKNAAWGGIEIDTATRNAIHIDDCGAGYQAILIDDAGDHAIEINSAYNNSHDAIHIDVSAGSGRYGVYINGTDSSGIYVDNAGSNGLNIQTAGYHGVYVGTTSEDGLYVYNPSKYGVRVNTTGAGYSALEITNSGGRGIRVNNSATGYQGILIDDAGDHAIEINSAYSTSKDAIHIDTSGASDYSRFGVYINGTSDDGIYITSAGDNGITINNTTDRGIYMASTGTEGIYIYSTTSSYSGLKIQSSGGDGVEIVSSGYHGIDIQGTSDGNTYDAIHINTTGYTARYGVYIDNAKNAGVYVAGTTGNGVDVTANNNGISVSYAGYNAFASSSYAAYGLWLASSTGSYPHIRLVGRTGAHPTNYSEGDIYYNSTLHQLLFRSNTGWRAVSSTAA